MLYGFGLPHNPPSNSDFWRTSWHLPGNTSCSFFLFSVCQHLNCSQMLDVWSIYLTNRCRNMLVNYSMEHLGGFYCYWFLKNYRYFSISRFWLRTSKASPRLVLAPCRTGSCGWRWFWSLQHTKKHHESMSCDHFKHHSASFCIWLQDVASKFPQIP